MEFTLDFETERFRRFTEDLIDGMTDRGAERALKKTALDFLGRAIDKTPVDTGRARGGWASFMLSEGAPFDAGPGADAEAVEEGRAASYFKENYRSGEQFILLGNAVVYIVRLEYGWSDQAPAGMVRVTFRELAAQQALTEELRDQLQREIVWADLKSGSAARWRAAAPPGG